MMGLRDSQKSGHWAGVRWQGQSGRQYELTEDSLDDFILKSDSLYVLTQGGLARWIGSATDLIEDAASRERFRAAQRSASAILRLHAPSDPVQRMGLAFDIEGGHLANSLPVAC